MRTYAGLSLIALLTLVALSLPASAGSAFAAGPTPIKTLIVFTPGIDFLQSPSEFDPYARAFSSFGADSAGNPSASSIMGRLGCPQNPPDPLSGNPPFIACQNGVAWIPYSYTGVSGGQIAPYTGVQTGQALQTSVNAMQSIVTFAQSFPEAQNAKQFIVAHSLGGAVAAAWSASTGNSANVITLDSPVNGIWPESDATLAIYCNNSVGLIQTVLQQVGCNFILDAPVLNSPVIADLRNPENIRQMGRAKALNIANTADAFVASWFAVNPASRLGALLVNSTCTETGDPFGFNHFCVLITAAPQVVSFIQTGTPPAPTPVRTTINLEIKLFTGTIPFNGTVTISGAGWSRSVPSVGGLARVNVPWSDSVVQVQHAGSTLSLGALPGADQDLTLNLIADSQAPSKTCTPANPPAGGSTTCVLSLTSPLPVDGVLVDTATGPAGATITNCGSETGGLSCGGASESSAIAACTQNGAQPCAAGSSITLTIQATGGGPLTEVAGVTAQQGQALIQFPVTPVPPVTFGP